MFWKDKSTKYRNLDRMPKCLTALWFCVDCCWHVIRHTIMWLDLQSRSYSIYNRFSWQCIHMIRQHCSHTCLLCCCHWMVKQAKIRQVIFFYYFACVLLNYLSPLVTSPCWTATFWKQHSCTHSCTHTTYTTHTTHTLYTHTHYTHTTYTTHSTHTHTHTHTHTLHTTHTHTQSHALNLHSSTSYICMHTAVYACECGI